ncbi:hypothetical protein AbraIFM66951_004830 [Aspergillus brasiliensis]|nr:hypothetical protein AbraCBS73388_003768 [Aspergillus brasiliensis]GKZ51017.1 hypothetical protein AbraIFM66951_004830 [Aspergillus brasiliensis]
MATAPVALNGDPSNGSLAVPSGFYEQQLLAYIFTLEQSLIEAEDKCHRAQIAFNTLYSLYERLYSSYNELAAAHYQLNFRGSATEDLAPPDQSGWDDFECGRVNVGSHF